MKTWACLLLLCAHARLFAGSGPPSQIHEYLRFLVAYAPHAETLWHGADGAGYWGDGLSRGNGGIRGTSNLTLACAVLVHALDQGWLTDAQRGELARAGLDRGVCLDRVRQSWRYLAGSHVTGDAKAADGKKWGRSWQSSLWVGASGLAALLVWDDLGDEVRVLVQRVIVDEANRKIAARPRDSTPGNTAAEENGWDTHAPAIAVALFPDHPNAAKWLRAAQILAANTYSVRADHESDAALGRERVRDVVCTTNLFDDFTLDNHGFFHPSYLKVSGQEIGEAWVMMGLGDKVHGTSFAPEYRPYALHHVADTWSVMRTLLLPEGEYLYPSGSDWAIHLCSHQSYYAFIATAFGDPVAALAERRGFTCGRWRMRASSGGRFLGATNFEWWWEPIVLKRFATAMWHFILSPTPAPAPAEHVSAGTQTFHYRAVGVFGHRTPLYVATVSTRGRPTGFVVPLGDRHMEHPYVVTPRVGSILPPGRIDRCTTHTHKLGSAIVLHYGDGTRAAMVGLGRVVLWLSRARLGPIAIENDNVVTGQGRTVRCAGKTVHVPALKPKPRFTLPGRWANVDEQLGLIAAGGFQYVPASRYTRRSAAEDLVRPEKAGQVNYLLVAPRASADETARLAQTVSVEQVGRVCRAQFRDGPDGPLVRVAVDLGALPRMAKPVDLATPGSASPGHPMGLMTDDDADTFCVLRNEQGTGPTPQTPTFLSFAVPAAQAVRGLRIVPRRRYGPRSVEVQTLRQGTWRKLAGADLRDELCDIALNLTPDDRRLRVVITRGWDRGPALAAKPRNTQIAELAFLLADSPSDGDQPPAFELDVIETGR